VTPSERPESPAHTTAMTVTARPPLPGPAVHPVRRTLRYVLARIVSTIVIRSIVRVRVEGRDRLPAGQYLLCFSHANWIDPFVLMAVLPWRPRLYFFGPKEEDMSVGGRNHLMMWAGNAVPYRPGKNDLLDATRRVQVVFNAGGVLAIAGEGRIHAREDEILRLQEGAAYFALRARVPIVPVAISGTTWFSIGSRVRIRIGQPIPATGRPRREAVEALTTATWTSLCDLVRGSPQPRRPGRIGTRLTELFNDWPEGSRQDH
jgi:1-acyl-sn-glycerol-3-phosphate acyltransferase